MTCTQEDLDRLAFEVRRFLDAGDWRRRVLGMAKLYLEMPDVGAMFALKRDIMQALSPVMLACGEPIRVVDEETIEIPVGGVSIILTCKQRFMREAGRPVGFASIQFVEADLRNDERDR